MVSYLGRVDFNLGVQTTLLITPITHYQAHSRMPKYKVDPTTLYVPLGSIPEFLPRETGSADDLQVRRRPRSVRAAGQHVAEEGALRAALLRDVRGLRAGRVRLWQGPRHALDARLRLLRRLPRRLRPLAQVGAVKRYTTGSRFV